MPDWSLVNRSHVMAALQEYDKVGDRDFLRRYGYRRSIAYTLWHQGREYDARAVVGAACFLATGTAPRHNELGGGKSGPVRVLIDLGLDVVVDEDEVLATERPRAAAVTTSAKSAKSVPAPKAAKPPKPAKRQTAAEREAATKLCPSCYMAVPASGICDFCD